MMTNVRFGSKADICDAKRDVRFHPKADMCSATRHVRLVPIADIPRADRTSGNIRIGWGSPTYLLPRIAPPESTCGPSIASNPYKLTVKHQG